MSLRSSRRSQAAAAAAAGIVDVPSVPIAEIRVRKWTKQLKTVGHISILKWVPDQENPTEALQKGSFKKTKGRKRPAVEVGRMTRSVRQHLDAPLELLNEIPSTRSTRASSAAPSAASTPAPTPAPADASVTETQPAPIAHPSAAPAPASTAEPAATTVPPADDSLMGMAGDSMMFTDGVASEEQLERALDDLPFLDTENLALDPALAMGRPNSTAAASPSTSRQEPPATAPHDASSSSASSGGEDEDDEDDDDDDTASANSASPMPSPSPTMSPVMSRSPSP